MSNFGKIQLTARGFERIIFQDLYNESCSLQQSSVALCEPPGSGAVWLGCNDSRMHLNVDQVRALVGLLQNWLDTGSFEGEDTE